MRHHSERSRPGAVSLLALCPGSAAPPPACEPVRPPRLTGNQRRARARLGALRAKLHRGLDGLPRRRRDRTDRGSPTASVEPARDARAREVGLAGRRRACRLRPASPRRRACTLSVPAPRARGSSTPGSHPATTSAAIDARRLCERDRRMGTRTALRPLARGGHRSNAGELSRSDVRGYQPILLRRAAVRLRW